MQRVHLRQEEADLVVRMHQRGVRQVEIAELFNTSQSVISRTVTRFRQTGTASRRPGSGSERVTTPREDRFLIIQARRQPFATARQHMRSLVNATGTRVSDQTVRNRLWEVRLTSYRPQRRPPLTRDHKRQRRIWAEQRLEEATPWEDILFTDESRFCIHNDSRRKRVYREQGHRYLPQYIQPVVAFGGGGVMVWAGISLGYRTNLHIFDGNVNARRYEEEIIMGHVLPRGNEIGRENLIFLDDNARPHRAQNVIRALNDNEINRLPLTPHSPDLNPIEHVWDMLQKRMDNHNPQPTTVRELRHILPILWHEIPQEHIDNCIESMPNRCQAVIDARGGSTRY